MMVRRRRGHRGGGQLSSRAGARVVTGCGKQHSNAGAREGGYDQYGTHRRRSMAIGAEFCPGATVNAR
jgi:hypothetical protein